MKESICGYKFELYPSDEQESYLVKVFGCCMFVYNYFLFEKQNRYKDTKSSDDCNVQQTKMTELCRNDEHGFLNDITLQSLRCSLRNIHSVYDRFYKHKVSYPNLKFKRYKQTFKIAHSNTFNVIDSKLYILKLKSGIGIAVFKGDGKQDMFCCCYELIS